MTGEDGRGTGLITVILILLAIGVWAYWDTNSPHPTPPPNHGLSCHQAVSSVTIEPGKADSCNTQHHSTRL